MAAGQAAVAVACSGGPDSMALLWVVWRCAGQMGLRTHALHVQHGLQTVARNWPDFIARECARWSRRHPELEPIRLHVQALPGRPSRGQSVEAWAHEGRHAALQSMALQQGIDLLLLAHHRADQAETFLLQALRGAGPQGLAAMPARQWRQGVCWARPFLGHSRQAVRGVLVQAKLRSVDDPSNADTVLARNALRHTVWPALQSAFPQVEAALAGAALRCAQSLETMEQGVLADLARCGMHEPFDAPDWRLNLSAWSTVSAARRSQMLRKWWANCGVQAPSSLVDGVSTHAFDPSCAQRWPMDDGHELRWYRGVLSVSGRRLARAVRRAVPEGARHEPKATSDPLQWMARRSGTKRLPGWGGRLILRRAGPGETGADLALPLALQLRARSSEDRFRLAPLGSARPLKKQFQARAVPAWDRLGPVVADDQGRLLWVPGLGWDARVARLAGGWLLEWEADAPA